MEVLGTGPAQLADEPARSPPTAPYGTKLEATMNHRSKSLGLLLALVLAGALDGCTQPADPLESLIARHVEARGGIERLEAIQTLRASGKASAGPGQEALVMREVRPPGRVPRWPRLRRCACGPTPWTASCRRWER